MSDAESVLWPALSPLPALPSLDALPERVDLLVVGAGYTGLAAARAAARVGASVLVLERGPFGAGASSRNGGMVLPGYKAELADVARRHGQATARALWGRCAGSLASKCSTSSASGPASGSAGGGDSRC